jgi:hypothetical protein
LEKNEKEESDSDADKDQIDSSTIPQNKDKEIKKVKKSDKYFPIIRPIIFICNDLYDKSLRPLRDISFQIKIP